MTWQEWYYKKILHLHDLQKWLFLPLYIPHDSQELGRWGEWQAGRFLKQKGFRLLLQNVRMRCGEIDWIAVDHDILVFVEVKTRGRASMAHPIFAIDWKKRRRLRNAARLYLHSLHQTPLPTFRFDAVEVLIDRPSSWNCQWTPRLTV